MLTELLAKTRSFRRFQQEPGPSLSTLKNLIALTRLTPSAANRQPLKYVAVQNEEKRREVFSCLTWAGYLKEWDGPTLEEQPTGYIVIVSDPKLSANPHIDVGIAAQTILLGARELGFGGCLIGSIHRPHLREYLMLPENLEIHLVIALGAPGEQVNLTTMESDDDIHYWRDKEDVHHVPKRPLQALILNEF